LAKDTLADVRAAPLLIPLALAATAAGCGSGDSVAQHQRYLWVQTCAECHAIALGRQSPDVHAPNLAATHPGLQQVRRAVIDGRPGMPKGLLGGADVDSIAAYVVARTKR
jgi:mono/diheme cytochrome c family protein